MFLYSEVYCDSMGPPAKVVLCRGLPTFSHYSNLCWPKAGYVRPSLAKFIRRMSKFAYVTVWSSMMQFTASEVIKYLFHKNVQPMAVYR